ncbi:hypothetical protein VNO77_02134 [Canavalia gladiata]|uniref:Uncharacterized protein n=1 Tax=Canavalia gladiata TaxID=3824 RepID=A0AAN9R2R8_CANGL
MLFLKILFYLVTDRHAIKHPLLPGCLKPNACYTIDKISGNSETAIYSLSHELRDLDFSLLSFSFVQIGYKVKVGDRPRAYIRAPELWHNIAVEMGTYPWDKEVMRAAEGLRILKLHSLIGDGVRIRNVKCLIWARVIFGLEIGWYRQKIEVEHTQMLKLIQHKMGINWTWGLNLRPHYQLAQIADPKPHAVVRNCKVFPGL